MISGAFTLLNRRIYPWSSRVLHRKTVITTHLMQNQASSHANIQPRFSSGVDENQLMTETQALLKCKWTFDEDQMGVQKTFNFPTFAKALVTQSSGQRRCP